MKRLASVIRKKPLRETLTEGYEVRAFRDESEAPRETEVTIPGILHPDPVEFQTIKKTANGHGEQTILPDDSQYGDNDLCNLEE